jgi:hypothetical protein
MIAAVVEAAPSLPVVASCSVLRVPRATFYRSKRMRPPRAPRRQRRALSAAERGAVLDVLHEPSFVDNPSQCSAGTIMEKPVRESSSTALILLRRLAASLN